MFKFFSDDLVALEVVKTALFRSHPVQNIQSDIIHVFISPSDHYLDQLKISIKNNKKILIFGSLTNDIASLLLLEINGCIFSGEGTPFVCIDETESFNKSNLYLNYNSDHSLTLRVPYDKRYFLRFDFSDEWNNQGYGAIDLNNDIWSIKQKVNCIGATSLVKVHNNDVVVTDFATITDFKNSSILYVNRDVSFVDGLDWVIIEDFLSKYRSADLPILPLMLELPYNKSMVVSSRLDCDQSVISSRPLSQLYRSYDINLSLAVTTGIGLDDEDISFLNEFILSGGCVLSHSVNHHVNWGASYSHALEEMENSKKWLISNISALSEIKYAVSPFHTNKTYSIEAFFDSGYKGFISGIIHNDPEFLIGVSGQVPFTMNNLISHSQQCMLHGDCYHRSNNSLDIYKETFNLYKKSGRIFAYLDHPFGSYQYGWLNESERLSVHKDLIEYINQDEGVSWMTSNEILDFVYDKSTVSISLDKNGSIILNRSSYSSNEKISIEYMGGLFVC